MNRTIFCIILLVQVFSRNLQTVPPSTSGMVVQSPPNNGYSVQPVDSALNVNAYQGFFNPSGAPFNIFYVDHQNVVSRNGFYQLVYQSNCEFPSKSNIDYKIVSALNPSVVLDVNKDSNSQKMVVYKFDGSVRQRFSFMSDDQCNYIITNLDQKNDLSVANTAQGTQSQASSSNTQKKWKITRANKDKPEQGYTIFLANTNLAQSVHSGFTDNNTPVVSWPVINNQPSANQRWFIVPA